MNNSKIIVLFANNIIGTELNTSSRHSSTSWKETLVKKNQANNTAGAI